MIAVLQRVRRASVEVEGDRVGAIERGLLVLLGVAREDEQSDADYLVRRLPELRVFEDPRGHMNLSLQQVRGAVLAVPQFTLLAGLRRGRRPEFLQAAEPDLGRQLFDHFVAGLRANQVVVETGVFGATMLVALENQGPATFILDTQVLRSTPR